PLYPTPNRKIFTRADCEKMVATGTLVGRYELIDGEIISKMGQKTPHAFVVMTVMNWLSGLFGSLRVRCQGPIEVAFEDREINEPEPDFAVLREPASAYLEKHPGPGDILLIIEASDTSLRFDLEVKSSLYARAGIPEYWVLDIGGRRLISHRAPETG